MTEEVEVVKTPKKKKDWKSETKSIILIVVSVLVFRSVFFEPFKIPTGSMIPTLMIGDFILVNKFSYGFKIPFTDWFGDPKYVTGPEMPKRGDVIVFKYPKDTSFNYIKRVIGLPGDTVEVINKIVYVNNEPIEATEFDGKAIMDDMDEKFSRYNLKFYQTQTGEANHVVQLDQDNYYNSDFYKITVPEGNLFVMGDNRDFSADSRFWGFVPFGHVKGKAILIWFSLGFPWPWENTDDEFVFRPWRIGTLIK